MNKKSIIISVVFVVVLILALGAFESVRPQQEDDGIFYFHQFEDFGGEKITLTHKPKRVAVLFSSLADVWTLSGGEVLISVGESVERGICNDEVLLVDSGAGKTIDAEKLLSYKPDFVIYSLDVEAQVKTSELLKKSKIPAAGMRLDSIEDYMKALTICTSVLDNEDALKKYGTDVLQQIENIKMKSVSSSYMPDVLFIRSGSTQSSAKAKKADDNFAAKILEDLGCINIADQAEILLESLSIEEILLRDPDHIFISIMGDESAGKAYMEGLLLSDSWRELSAVKNGNVHYLPKDLFHYKPCQRWAESYEYIYEILYQGDGFEE